MNKKKTDIERNASTEEKIKEAARKVFTQKGFAATRTRDIAEESGYNLALINYYFRSKENLFDIIMLEQLQVFMHNILDIVNDRATTLQQKMEILIAHYIDMLMKNPDLPLFILNEVKNDPQKLVEKLGLAQAEHKDVYIAQQWQQMVDKGVLTKFNPIHLMMNMISLTIFPFVARPLIRNRMKINTEEFNALMEERKKLIPVWMKAIMTTPIP